MDLNTQLNKRMEEVYIKTPFNAELPDIWYTSALIALKHSSPIQLGMMGPEMYELEEKIKGRERMSMYEFACINTLLEKTTRIQLDYDDDQYYDLLAHTARYAEVWNRWGGQIQKQIQEEILTERAKELKRKGKIAQA